MSPVIVDAVVSGSGAAAADVRPGWRLTHIAGEDVTAEGLAVVQVSTAA